ncbi:TolC family protein, partial [Bradyrhizobium sp. LA7.1]|uniref:TolC family protein n=1 Tax=Bradyrhizobium sp. LA7.1 TaxID=3156324 RepID=UPI003397F8E1
WSPKQQNRRSPALGLSSCRCAPGRGLKTTLTQQQALAVYEQTIKAALADVESSLVAYAQAQQRAAILGKAAKAARQAEELARIQYHEGIASLLDVLEAQRQRLQTETQLVTAQAAVGQRYAALYKSLGGGGPR